jgi:hypothetical protein
MFGTFGCRSGLHNEGKWLGALGSQPLRLLVKLSCCLEVDPLHQPLANQDDQFSPKRPRRQICLHRKPILPEAVGTPYRIPLAYPLDLGHLPMIVVTEVSRALQDLLPSARTEEGGQLGIVPDKVAFGHLISQFIPISWDWGRFFAHGRRGGRNGLSLAPPCQQTEYD